MPAFTFTADSGTDALTITAHGLLTGDGPAAVRNVGGALPAATPALGPLLDRWIIRVDANTIKLAESSSLALAGTPINITSNGTGTNILEIGVPYRRPRTYAPGVQLKSADLNANFDAWPALHGLLTGQAQGIWDSVTLAEPLTLIEPLVPNGGISAFTANGLITASAGVTTASGPISLQGIVTPPELQDGSSNNYNPTGLSTAVILRIGRASGGPFLSGLAGGTSGRVITLVNVNTVDIGFVHEDFGSSAANRFLLANGSLIAMRDNGAITFWYDSTSSRWRVLSQNL